MPAEKTILHHLQSGMVLDRSQFVALPIVDMTQIIGAIRVAGPKKLVIVDDMDSFFTPHNLVALMSVNDKSYNLVNEYLGGFFTEAQIGALMHNHVQNHEGPAPDVAHEDGLVVNLDKGYTYAPVPEGWSVGTHMSLGPTKIKRKVKNSDGDGTMFAMDPLNFEKLWLHAAKAWSGHLPAQGLYFYTNQGKLKATIQDDRIALGGNYIRRYEIEQVAKHRNWALPEQLQQAA